MSPAERFFRRLASVQARHPWRILALVALSTVPAAWAAAKLGLRTDWTELLPESKRSIQDLHRIQARFGSAGTFTVAVEGDDLKAMERFADALAAELAKLPPDLVRAIDKDLNEEKAFVERNRFLYADLADLVDVRDKLRRKLTEEKTRAALDLGLDEAEPDFPPVRPVRKQGEAPKPSAKEESDPLHIGKLRKLYEDKTSGFSHYPDGYYVGESGHLLALFLRTAASSNDLAATNRLESEVHRIVERVDPKRFHPSLQVRYAGDVLTARAEHDALRDEMFLVSAIAISAILVVIYLFYFELRAIFVLGAGIVVGLVWTFGLTWLRIGYLSTATSFLSSIVAGNGINSGIILMARYLEEQRRGRGAEEAAAEGMVHTWAATLTASTAASLSYAALMLTDFRGFNQFGFIGATGMLLSWIGNYLVMPPLLAGTQGLMSRLGPRPRRSGFYGRPFLWLSERAPRAAVVSGVLLALAGAAAGILWLKGDPFEYDFRNLRNQRSQETGVGLLTTRINAITEHRPGEGTAILADRPEQVPLLEQAFARIREERRDALGRAPIGEFHSIGEVIPPEQERKLPVLREIRGLALDVLPTLSEKSRAEAEPWVPPTGLAPVTLETAPESLLRPFTEKDGRIGLAMAIEAPRGVSMWDGRHLLRFAEAIRAVKLADGEVIHTSGRPVIFADMLNAIREDGPWLTLASFAFVFLLVLVSFRGNAHRALVLFALLVGMGWMMGVAALSGIKLNFLNFVAIPITFGIGVDYAVNMVRRYAQDGWGATPEVLVETGGAVILCSLTTIFGYLSLLCSDNQALRSFGKLAVLGEVTCLSASVLVLPGLVKLVTLAARRGEGGRGLQNTVSSNGSTARIRSKSPSRVRRPAPRSATVRAMSTSRAAACFPDRTSA